MEDVDGANDDRAAWAAVAIKAFQEVTGTDDVDALIDLLCDLMHWADRNDHSFQYAVERALHHYLAETGQGGPLGDT